MRQVLISLFCFSIAGFSFGQNPPGTIQIRSHEILWKDVAGGPLPSGAKVAVLEGNPKQEGMFTQRLFLPPGTVLMPHWHPREERVTVLDGCVYVAFGDSLDWTKGHVFEGGSFYLNPPKQNHYVWTIEGAWVQITGMGPWELNFVKKE
jgi:hypothetical protein